ncbi:hypothetical protein D3C71_1715440 [compost metagenome]
MAGLPREEYRLRADHSQVVPAASGHRSVLDLGLSFLRLLLFGCCRALALRLSLPCLKLFQAFRLADPGKLDADVTLTVSECREAIIVSAE